MYLTFIGLLSACGPQNEEAFTSNSSWAQGGISCVMDEADSIKSHVADTLDAGAGLCNKEVVQRILEGGREGIKLEEQVLVTDDAVECLSTYPYEIDWL